MNKNYTNYYKKPYNPKRAIKSFQDLDIYQRALESNVFVVKEIVEKFEKKIERKKASAGLLQYWATTASARIIDNLFICSSKIPHLLAESHSKRFGTGTECLDILDEAMLQCNKAVVYLAQVRDICNTGIELEQFEEQIKKYFYNRGKILNLQRVWRKYIKENE